MKFFQVVLVLLFAGISAARVLLVETDGTKKFLVNTKDHRAIDTKVVEWGSDYQQVEAKKKSDCESDLDCQSEGEKSRCSPLTNLCIMSYGTCDDSCDCGKDMKCMSTIAKLGASKVCVQRDADEAALEGEACGESSLSDVESVPASNEEDSQRVAGNAGLETVQTVQTVQNSDTEKESAPAGNEEDSQTIAGDKGLETVKTEKTVETGDNGLETIKTVKTVKTGDKGLETVQTIQTVQTVQNSDTEKESAPAGNEEDSHTIAGDTGLEQVKTVKTVKTVRRVQAEKNSDAEKEKIKHDPFESQVVNYEKVNNTKSNLGDPKMSDGIKKQSDKSNEESNEDLDKDLDIKEAAYDYDCESNEDDCYMDSNGSIEK